MSFFAAFAFRSRAALAPALVVVTVVGCDCDVDPVEEIVCDFAVKVAGGAEHDFGAVIANEQTREATFVIENTGNRTLNAFAFTFSGNGDQYDVDVPDDFSIAPNDDEALIVVFRPTRVTAALPATLNVGHTDLGEGCPVRSLTLLGEGIAEPVVDAGFPDAGPVDAGNFVDAGFEDGGFIDAPDGGVTLPPDAVWRAYGGFEEARAGFATVELLDGTLLAVGGWGENGAVLDSIEKFDPATGRSRVIARMAQPRAEPGAVMLADGRVAIVGGRNLAVGGVVVTTVETIDPSTGTLACPGTQAVAGRCTDNSLGFLQNARINPIVTSLGGASIAVGLGRALDDDAAEVALAGGEVVDVNSGIVTPIDGLAARVDEARVVGPDGSFVVVGGRNLAGIPSAEVVRFDAVARTAGVIATLPAARAGAGAGALADGSVLVVGGANAGGAPLGDAVLVEAAFDNGTVVTPLTLSLEPRVQPVVTVFADDLVVVAGGLPQKVFGDVDDDSVVPLTSGEVLVPFGPAGFVRLAVGNDLAVGRVGAAAVVTGEDDDAITYVGGFSSQPRKTPHPHAEQYVLVDNAFVSFGLMGAGSALTAGAVANVSVAALVAVGGTDPHTQSTSARVRGFAADEAEGFFFEASSLAAARRDHSATSIAADLVVVIGGRDATGAVIGSASILDLDGADLALPVSLRRPRAGHTATLLPDDAGVGENAVLVCGGVGAGGEPLDTCELFVAPANPRDEATFATASFTLVGGRMSLPRVGHTATLFENGEVLLAGGGDIENDQGAADLFLPDPADPRLVATGVPVRARRDHAAVNLGGGRVLLCGGDVFEGGVGPTRSAELYNRNSESFVAVGDMEEPRSKPAAFLLNGGGVLVAGGTKLLGEPGFPTISVVESELYDPGASGVGTFEAIEIPLSYGRSDLVQVDVFGRAVVVGGTHRDGVLRTGDERRSPQIFVDKLEEGAE